MADNHRLAAILIASAVSQIGSPLFAAPAKPLIVLFTPGISANAGTSDENAVRAKRAVLAMRDCFNDTGLVDAIVYSPDNALFVRGIQESKLKLHDPQSPDAVESFALAKAVGADYVASVVSGLPSEETAGAVDIELQTEQVDGHKIWHSRHNVGNGSTGLGQFDNALRSATNTLVQDFLRGPLHNIAQMTLPNPSALPSIPTVAETPPVNKGSLSNPEPNLSTPVPMTAATAIVAPVKPSESLNSSGADTDNAAEAQRQRGDEQLRTGDLSGAILSYRRSINLSPLNLAYRSTLISAYLQKGRKEDALSEAKRALQVIPETSPKDQMAASHLLADVLLQNGDTVAARSTYQTILKTQPEAVWAKVGLAEVLISEGNTGDALTLYQEARQSAPTDKEVLLGLARLLATKGDYDGALKQLTAATGNLDTTARYQTAISLFDDGVTKIAERIKQNRAAFENKKIAQEVFYKATSTQTAKVSGLVALLKAVPPPDTVDETTKRKHQKRIFAASLLLQGVASLLTQVETGEEEASSEATLFLTEFAQEMHEIVTTPPISQP